MTNRKELITQALFTGDQLTQTLSNRLELQMTFKKISLDLINPTLTRARRTCSEIFLTSQGHQSRKVAVAQLHSHRHEMTDDFFHLYVC